jgi:hypothetical protein
MKVARGRLVREAGVTITVERVEHEGEMGLCFEPLAPLSVQQARKTHSV